MTAAATSTLSRFPAAAADFVRDLYAEHLEEASFLYDQRNYMLENIEMEPHDIAWNEQRCDRHLDALVAGGDLTLTMCMERAAAGEESGELYAAMRIFCRADRPDLVKSVLNELDTEDAELMAAARDGLKHELPQSWSAQVSQWLDEADEPRAAILAVASAYRELKVGPAIVLNASGPLANPVPFLWALGRLGEPTAAVLFQKYLQNGDDERRQAAAIGALRCRDAQVPDVLRQTVASGEGWAAVPLALVGELSDFVALERVARVNGPSAALALAQGLLGHVGALGALLDWLEADAVAPAAALALHLLTGAYPLEHAAAEENPPDGRDIGPDTTEAGFAGQRLAQSRAPWEGPCDQLRRVAKTDVHVQFGEAESISAIIREFASPRLPVHVRNLLSDALLIRHGVHASPCDDQALLLHAETLQKGLD